MALLPEAVALSQVYVALDIFYQHIVHVCRGVVYTITFVFAMFILRPIHLLSTDSSCNICCSSCGVSVHRNMWSAKRRLERNSSSIFTPLFSQFNLLDMLSNVAVDRLGEMVSPWLSLSWFSHSLRAYVLSLSCPYIWLSGFICTHLLFLVLAMMSILLGFVLSQYKKAKHSGLLYSRHVLLFKMVYGMYATCRRAVS